MLRFFTGLGNAGRVTLVWGFIVGWVRVFILFERVLDFLERGLGCYGF